MEEKTKAWLRELSLQPEGARRQDSHNLAFAFPYMNVCTFSFTHIKTSERLREFQAFSFSREKGEL